MYLRPKKKQMALIVPHVFNVWHGSFGLTIGLAIIYEKLPQWYNVHMYQHISN